MTSATSIVLVNLVEFRMIRLRTVENPPYFK